jgi:DNA-binding CsgD family transcriptional regulator
LAIAAYLIGRDDDFLRILERAHHADQAGEAVHAGPPAAAYYQEAEVHRLRGEFAAAEAAYRNASRWGCEPQPGLALLRLAQGRTDAAAAAIRRVVSTNTGLLQRTRLLPAYVEIMLACGDVQEARRACGELGEIASRFDAGVLGAIAAQARGAVELAEGDPRAALGSLRRAGPVWQRVEAPYLAARVRLLVGRACQALGDDDGGRLELDAARAAFEQLGATPDVSRIDALVRGVPSCLPHDLTRRELQVLRLVAAGRTNKAIASELLLSVKTVDRHVGNILTKLDVGSRAAATAYAYEHKLV